MKRWRDSPPPGPWRGINTHKPPGGVDRPDHLKRLVEIPEIEVYGTSNQQGETDLDDKFCILCASQPCLCDLLKLELKLSSLKNNKNSKTTEQFINEDTNRATINITKNYEGRELPAYLPAYTLMRENIDKNTKHLSLDVDNLLSMKMNTIKLTEIKDEDDNDDDGDDGDVKQDDEERKEDEGVDYEGAPFVEDGVVGEINQLGKERSQAATCQDDVTGQVELSSPIDSEAGDSGGNHPDVSLHRNIPNLEKEENRIKYNKSNRVLPVPYVEEEESTLERSGLSARASSNTYRSSPTPPSRLTPSILPQNRAFSKKISENEIKTKLNTIKSKLLKKLKLDSRHPPQTPILTKCQPSIRQFLTKTVTNNEIKDTKDDKKAETPEKLETVMKEKEAKGFLAVLLQGKIKISAREGLSCPEGPPGRHGRGKQCRLEKENKLDITEQKNAETYIKVPHIWRPNDLEKEEDLKSFKPTKEDTYIQVSGESTKSLPTPPTVRREGSSSRI